MTDHAAISAQLVDVRNVGQHKCVKLTLHVPAEQAGAVMEAFGWPTMVDPVPVALARLNDKPEEAAEKPAQSPVRVASHMTTRAAICCNDPVFHAFLNETYRSTFPQAHVQDADGAASLVRFLCDVQSRKEIIPGTRAGDKWDALYSKFIGWRDVA